MSISVKQLRDAIKKLPPDPPRDVPGKWYKSQHEHWLGWLAQYDGPGAYGRKTGVKRDARYAYNHIVCSEMLSYLIEAIELDPELVRQAHDAATQKTTLMAKSSAMRRVVPWEMVEYTIGDKPKQGALQQLSNLIFRR